MFGTSAFAETPFASLSGAATGAGTWVIINNTQTFVWASINNTQSTAWATINNAQPPNWVDVDSEQY
jgi:hypothetical protein